MDPRDEIRKECLESIVLDRQNRAHRAKLAPRAGKTRLMIELIKREVVLTKILWVSVSSQLLKKDLPKEFVKWGAEKYLAGLNTVTYKALDNIVGHYDLIILDEDQHVTRNNLRYFFTPTVTWQYIVSMTGTPSRSKIKLEIYRKLKLKTSYELTIKRAVELGLLSDYTVKIVPVDMSTDKAYQAKNFTTTEAKQYAYLNGKVEDEGSEFAVNARANLIRNSQSKTVAAINLMKFLKGSVLVFCSTTEQADKVCKHTYHSKTNKEDYEDFCAGNIDRIAMVNSGGTGSTYTKRIDNLVIVQAERDLNGSTSQKICRTLLRRENYTAKIWVIKLADTIDEVWVDSALERFESTKVKTVKKIPNKILQ